MPRTLLALANELPDEFQRIGVAAEWAPSSSSKARAELDDPVWGTPSGSESPMEQAYWMAWAVTQAARQNLLAVYSLAEARERHGVAVVSAGRACVEAAARACWLLEPSDDSRSRGTKALAERAAQIEYMSRIDESKSAALHKPSEVRAREFLQACADRNVTALAQPAARSTRWQARVEGCHVPKLVEFLEVALPSELARFVYSTMSTVAHAEPMSLWSYVEIREGGTRRQQFWLGIDDRVVVSVLLTALFVSTEACERYVRWCDWSSDLWDDLTADLASHY